MDASAWLRLVGSYTPEPLHGPKLARLLALAPRFEQEFPAHAFTPDTARRVGKALPDTLPTYEAIAGALRFAMPADALPQAEAETPEQRRGRIWAAFITAKLRAGADPANLLSLAQQQVPASELPGILATHWPEVAKAEAARTAEVRRDKARAAEQAAAQLQAAQQVAQAVGSTWRAPPLHAQPAPPPAHLAKQPAAAPRQSLVHPLQMLRKLEAAVEAGDTAPATRAAAVALRARLEGDAKAMLRALDQPREQEAVDV